MTKRIFLLATLNLFIGSIKAHQNIDIPKPTRQDTLNGSITPERIWWDILHYDITVKPNYNTKTLVGKNIIKYKVIRKKHSELMQIDLVNPLAIDKCVSK